MVIQPILSSRLNLLKRSGDFRNSFPAVTIDVESDIFAISFYRNMLDTVLRSALLPNATRYDLLRAAPGEADLRLMWLAWAITSSLSGAADSTIILGVLSSRTARSSVFNQYLVALIIPDLVLSISCAMSCALNHANNGYVGPAMCEFQSFYVVFGVAGAIYMNALGVFPAHAQQQNHMPAGPATASAW